MPQEIALYGVLIPVAVAIGALLAALALLVLLRGWNRGVGAFLEPRVAAPVLALAMALSYHARQGWRLSPRSAWEWWPLALVVITALALFVPNMRDRDGRRAKRRFAPLIIVGASIVCGSILAAALRLPGLDSIPWRLSLGGATAILMAVLALTRTASARSTGALALSASLAGLAMVTIASGFEKLTTIAAAMALTLGLIGAVGFFTRRVLLGSAGAALGAGAIVGTAAIGAAYSPGTFPFWHWPVALSAPLFVVFAERWGSFDRSPDRAPGSASTSSGDRVRCAIRAGAPALVAFGNGVAALAPLIARGDFPPH